MSCFHQACMVHGDDYNNINVQEIREQLGDFKYEDAAYEKQLGQCEHRPLVLLENGAQYEGEWTRGTQIR